MARNKAASDTPGPVVVEIQGIAAPATFARLPDAVRAVWDSMRVLPLGAVQADAFQYFFTRPDAVERTLEFLERDGQLSLTFAMNGRSHQLRVSLVAPVGSSPATLRTPCARAFTEAAVSMTSIERQQSHLQL